VPFPELEPVTWHHDPIEARASRLIDTIVSLSYSQVMTENLANEVKREARRLGFDLVGIAEPRPSDHLARYREWLARGYHADMGYLSRSDAVEKRSDPRVVMPEVQSIVVAGVNYYPGEFPPPRVGEGRVSRYAWGADYHDVLMGKLQRLANQVSAQVGRPVTHRAYVDFGPLMERELAHRAGLGWFGKNTNLINPSTGSYVFLGELLLDVALLPDEPMAGGACGSCTACLDACPTGALVAPGVLDARRCISYLTIEHRGAIPEALRSPLGDWVFGCDICQEVCPWNRRFAHLADRSLFQPGLSVLDLAELLLLGETEFNRRFRETPLWRARRAGLLRNAAVVLGNTASVTAASALESARYDEDELVRDHAAWALEQVRRS